MKDSIPICRSILSHWVYEDAEYLKVWLTMLSNARYLKEPKTVVYEKSLCTLCYGEFIFGRKAWSRQTKVSEQRLRGLIKLLIKDKMIELKHRTNHFSIYLIVNYAKFNHQTALLQEGIQGNSNQQVTSRQPPGNHQVTTNKEREEGKKEKNKDLKHSYSELVKMTSAEYHRLVDELGEPFVKRCIEVLDNYKGANGKEYKDDNRAIRSWVIKRVQEEQGKASPKSKIPRGFQDIINLRSGKSD